MIDRAYVQRMARYNRWQNENLYGVADRLSDDERRRERGAFFGSIHKTLSHLLWADQHVDEPVHRCAAAAGRHRRIGLALSRLGRLKAERAASIGTIIDWADSRRRRRGLPAISPTIRSRRSAR